MTIDDAWIVTTGTSVLMVAISALGIYVALLLLTRLVGLRSFSKMSSFDFAITVAMGSLVATVLLSESPPLAQGIAGLVVLFLIQFVVAALRNRSKAVQQIVDNQALLLMAGDEVLHENLRKARVTEDDLYAKLRAANVLHPDQVRAVVMETTGDISVLHADSDEPALDLRLLADVRDAERLKAKTNVRGVEQETPET